MRGLAIVACLGVVALAGSVSAEAQTIYSGSKTGAYYGQLCPALADGLRPEGFTPTCAETKGSMDNIGKLLTDPMGLAMVQTDAYATWAAAHPDDAKKTVTLRSDLASEGVYFVSKNVTSFGDMVRFITRIKVVVPPKGSGPAQTFENLKTTLPRVFGKLEDNQIIYADSVTKAIETAVTNDNTIALFVQLPDPANENFKLVINRKAHFIPVVAQALVDEKVGTTPVYKIETRPVKAGGIFARGLEVTTLATPIMIIAHTPDGLASGSNALQNYNDLVKAVQTLPREQLLPKTGSAASLFSRTWFATGTATQALLDEAKTALNGL